MYQGPAVAFMPQGPEAGGTMIRRCSAMWLHCHQRNTRLLTRRAECVCEHLATLDSHDVRCVSHFSRCRDSRRRWRRRLRVPRRVLGLLTDTVSGRLRSMRRVVVVSTTWNWRRRLTTTTVVYTTTPQLSTQPHHSCLHNHITVIYTTTPQLSTQPHHRYLHNHTILVYITTPPLSTKPHHSCLHNHAIVVYTTTPPLSTQPHCRCLHNHLLHTNSIY